MDEKYRKAVMDVFEEARTNVDILLRTREGYDGTLPFNMDEIREYAMKKLLGINPRVLQQHLRYNGGKECFGETLPWLKDAISRRISVFSSN